MCRLASFWITQAGGGQSHVRGAPSPKLRDGYTGGLVMAGGTPRLRGGATDVGDNAEDHGVKVEDGDGKELRVDDILPGERKRGFVRADPDVLRQLVERNPKDPDAWCSLAGTMINGKHMDLEAAINAYRRALELDPNKLLALNNIGHIHARRSELGDAEAAYRKALHFAPDHTPTLVNLGVLLYSQKNPPDWEAAEECFCAALKKEPEHFQCMVNYANFLMERPLEEMDEPSPMGEFARERGDAGDWRDGERAYRADVVFNARKESEIIQNYMTCKVFSQPPLDVSPAAQYLTRQSVLAGG